MTRIVTLFLLLLLSITSNAQIKFAVIDMEKLIRESKEFSKAESDLIAYQDSLRQKYSIQDSILQSTLNGWAKIEGEQCNMGIKESKRDFIQKKINQLYTLSDSMNLLIERHRDSLLQKIYTTINQEISPLLEEMNLLWWLPVLEASQNKYHIDLTSLLINKIKVD